MRYTSKKNRLSFLFVFITFNFFFLIAQQQTALSNEIDVDKVQTVQESKSIKSTITFSTIVDYVNHHMTDSDTWHFAPPKYFHFHLPHFKSVQIAGLSLDFSPSVHGVMILIASILMIALVLFIYRGKTDKAPKGISSLMEMVVLFVRDKICIENLGEEDGKKLAPFFLTLFLFIAVLNYLSLIPGMLTATANLAVVVALATIVLLTTLLLSLYRSGIGGFVGAFIPHMPLVYLPITIILFIIEFASIFIKPVSLFIRLFANMLAGHMVVFYILGLGVFTIFTLNWYLGSVGLVASVLLGLFIYMLELLVSFLQAYIFTMLSVVLVNSVLHPSH